MSVRRGWVGICSPSNFPKGVHCTWEISNPSGDKAGFLPRVQKTKRPSPFKEWNLTMQHLSCCQLENRLSIDMLISECGHRLKAQKMTNLIL